ncbi:MAG: MarR family transcriptional regulator [Rhizomicrobium sp.]|jgi:DNA-binding MarR family transcriptional regulator
MSDLIGALETARILHRSAAHLSRRLMAARGTEGLSVSRLMLLGRLKRQGPATATELAAFLRIQPQSLTRLLASLEESGLIARHADETDRRQNRIEITDAGARALIADVQGRRLKLAQAIEATLTPTEQALLRLLNELIDRLAAALETADGVARTDGEEDWA